MSDNSSSRATEHWFLDLDGVRSGPYQTPEVMSLVAEGEVMPHHRISTGLKDQPWSTVLDWRLEQAKRPSIHEKEVKEVHSYIPASSRPPANPPPEQKIELATEAPEVEVAPTHAEPEKETAAENSMDGWTESPIVEPTLPILEPEEKPAEPVRDYQLEAIIERMPSHVPPEPKAPEPIVTQSFETPASKRDPMAEMFDVIQTSKQKREAKSQQIAKEQSLSAPVATESTPTSGLTKTIIVGVLITIVGFALGQVFQQASPPSSTTVESKLSPATPATKVEVIDRSTDKMIIRGRVEVPVAKPTATPARPSLSTGGTRTAPSNSAGGARSEKELEELKDLKKELQELKALKDELKNNGGSVGTAPEEMPEDIGEFDNGNISNTEVDTGFNYYPTGPNTTTGGAAYDNGYPNQVAPQPNRGQSPANPNIHY